MDRETRDPLDLLDEIEKGLALTVAPMVWPIGQGKDFAGTYDLTDAARAPARDGAGRRTGLRTRRSADRHADHGRHAAPSGATRSSWCATSCQQLRSPGLPRRPSDARSTSARALKNFGVRDLLEALIAYAPPPRDQPARPRVVQATEAKMTGVVFKIQANMDPNHRDRIAFMRRVLRQADARHEGQAGAHRQDAWR